MSKIKKIMTTLMLFLTLSSTIIEPVSVLAETMNTVGTQEFQEDTESSESVEMPPEKAETSTTSSDQSLNTKADQQEKIGESQNANDSPTSNATDEVNQSVYEYLQEQGYEMLEDGTIVSTNGTMYRDNYLSVLQEVQNMLNPNSIITRMGRASGQSIYVTRDYGSSTIGWTYSNGISELGWYAKFDSDGGILWCVEPGVPLNWGQNYPYTTTEVSQEKYIRASLAVYYGWERQKSVLNGFYTERLVQEIATGVTTSGIYDYNGVASQSGYNTFRSNVLSEIESFFNLPSFAGNTYTAKLGETLTLTDTKGTLSKYRVTSNTANVTVTQSGNTLNITPKNDSNASGRLVLVYQMDPSYAYATLLFESPYLQNVIKAGVGDPVNFTVNLNIELEGHAEVLKVDETTGRPLAGAVFRFETSDGQTRELTTGADGRARWENLMVDTQVTITEIQAPTGYILNATPQTVTIRANETTTARFDNQEQLGTITINKSGVEFDKDMPNGNYTLAGNVFEIYEGTDTNGNLVDTITTDATGTAKSRNLPLGTYTVKEIQASEGYLLNTESWTVEIAYAGQSVAITNVDQAIENQEQKGHVVLRKRDNETNDRPQGDTTFAGARFDLFRTSDDTKLGTYTTDARGELTVRDLLIDDYYFIEVEAPVGYLLDTTPKPFSITYAGQAAAVAAEASVIKENQVIKGGFDLIKTANYNWYTSAWNWLTGKDPSGQPIVLEGVEFTVTQGFGNNEVVGKALTDHQGYVSFDHLPYGTYVVSESKVPTGYKRVADFSVTIDAEGQRFHYVVENKVKEAQVKFVKVDAETGKTIDRSNAGFEIYSKTTGEQLIMQDLQGKEHAVFYTDEKGVLQLPIHFAFGSYYAKEVKAPVGYVLAQDPIDFDVTGEEADGLLTVTIKNENQKGQVTLHKTVQTAISVETKESPYGSYSEIQFDQEKGAGFDFKIRPTEDIVTADGTIRFKAGEFLQKDGQDHLWITDSEGNFQTDAFLYIGHYELLEVKAPAGVNLQDTEPIPFEITYAGQNVAITSTTATAENYLQAINIHGHKQQEVITGWADGKAIVEMEIATNGQVFALKTGQALTIGETTLPGNTTLGYAVVADGIVSFENMVLPNVQADYYLQEVDAGSDHVLNEEQFFFTYTPATNDREHEIHIWADSFAENQQAWARIARKSILNELARATVRLEKTDELDGLSLENVTFDLVRIDEMTDEQGALITTETIISKHATDKDGLIVVDNLPTGKYKFIESKPLYWYEDNQEDLSFEITPTEDGETLTVEVTNQRKPLAVVTLFATTKEGHKQINPDIENELTDYGQVEGFKEGHTYYGVTEYVVAASTDPSRIGTIISSDEMELVGNGEQIQLFETTLTLPKGTLNDEEILSARHVFYGDKEKTKEVGRHNEDLTIVEQQVVAKAPKVAIHTKAHTGDNKTQTFTHGELITAYDNVNLIHENVLDGTKRAFEAILVAVTPDGQTSDIWTSGRIDYVVNDSEVVEQVKTTVDTAKYPEGTTFFFKEIGYNEAGEEDCRHNFDGKDKNQTLTPKPKKVMPKTGSTTGMILTVVGMMIVSMAGGCYIFRKKRA